MIRFAIIGTALGAAPALLLGLCVGFSGPERGNACEVRSQMQSVVRYAGPAAGIKATLVDSWNAQDVLATTKCPAAVIRYEDGSTVLKTR